MTEGLDKTPSPYISTSSYWEDQTGWATENNVQAHLSPIINISGANWRISKEMFSSFSSNYWLEIPTWKLFFFETGIPRLEMTLDLKGKEFLWWILEAQNDKWGRVLVSNSLACSDPSPQGAPYSHIPTILAKWEAGVKEVEQCLCFSHPDIPVVHFT